MTRRWTAVLVLVLALPLGVSGAAELPSTAPIIATVPEEVVAGWSHVSGLELSTGTTFRLTFDAPTPASGRVDVFQRLEGRWVWASAWKFDARSPLIDLPVTDSPLGVLVRFPATPLYAWTERRGGGGALALRLYKTLHVDAGVQGATITAYVAGADAPRSVTSRQKAAMLTFLPVAPALLCISHPGGASQCGVVAPESVEAGPLPGREAAHSSRIVRTPSAVFRVTAIAPSFSALRPRPVPVTVSSISNWMLLEMAGEDETGDLAIDFASDTLAQARVMFRELPNVPGFASVRPAVERGVAVRAAIRGVEVPLERDAQLLMLPQAAGVYERLPYARAKIGADGLFRFPDLGAGGYRLKLLATLAGNQPADASLSVGDPMLVTFDSGPVVKGKLELQAGGMVAEPPSVEIMRAGEVAQPQPGQKMPDDLTDWIRVAAVSGDGSFAAVVNSAGSYKLRARWGRGVATQEFTMKAPPGDLDLGTIPLVNAATVRGLVHDCPGGEVSLMPAPDLNRPMRLEFLDLRRAPTGLDGTFYVDSVPAGTWLFGATCAGQHVLLDPAFITVGGSDIMIEARPTNEEPVPPVAPTPPKP
jgi:hypothetical protein